MYQAELKITKQAAKEAGKFLKKEFFTWQKRNIEYKIHNERVTWCDKKAEQIIFKLLKKKFPKYAILSEESGRQDRDSEYTWIIDPLDGTTNFTIHHSMFAVSIALAYKNEIVLGVIYNPILDELYYASQGSGAFKNNKRLKLSKINTLKKSLVTYCHGMGMTNTKKAYKVYERFHGISHHCRHFGVTSLELSMLASGKTEAHLVPGAKLWDVAAGIIIVREAGGPVTDWQNKNWTIKSKTLVAAKKNIHTACLKELKKIKLA